MAEPTTPPPIEGIAVFHFGSADKSDPVRALLETIQEHAETLLNHLIVLPEGFNAIGGFRRSQADLEVDDRIGESLRAVSAAIGIAFIAGLIEKRPPRAPYNCAYLIDATLPFSMLVSRKHATENEGCEPAPLMCVPFSHRGLVIGVLIGDDFIACGDDFRKLVSAHKAWSQSTKRVLCVPVCSRSAESLREAHQKSWMPAGLQPAAVAVAAADGGDGLSYIDGGTVGTRILPKDSFLSENTLMYSKNELLISRFSELPRGLA